MQYGWEVGKQQSDQVENNNNVLVSPKVFTFKGLSHIVV